VTKTLACFLPDRAKDSSTFVDTVVTKITIVDFIIKVTKIIWFYD